MMKRVLLALAILACSASWALAGPLYGVSTTHLVIVDPATASITSTVGPLNLPAGVNPVNLAYHPGTHSLYSLGFTYAAGNVIINQHLVSINPSTGQGTIIATLGNPASVGYYEAIDFVHSLNSLVASRATVLGSFVTNQLVKLNLDGTVNPLVNTGLDNDHAAYDPTRDYFYTTDPNGTPGQQFFRVNLSNGTIINLGAIIPTMGELAYSIVHDAIFAIDYTNNRLYRVQLTNGGAPFTITTVGTIPGNQLQGIAFASAGIIPEPSTLVLFTSSVALLGPYCAWRRWKRRSQA